MWEIKRWVIDLQRCLRVIQLVEFVPFVQSDVIECFGGRVREVVCGGGDEIEGFCGLGGGC